MNDFKVDNIAYSKDHYLNLQNSVIRLLEEWDKYGKLIVAYDFDDTVCPSDNRPECRQIIELLRECKKQGCYMIVFTCRPYEEYDFVRKFLDDNDIPYDMINDNDPEVKLSTSRKIFYNIFLDDRCGLKSAYEIMVRTLEQRRDKMIDAKELI